MSDTATWNDHLRREAVVIMRCSWIALHFRRAEIIVTEFLFVSPKVGRGVAQRSPFMPVSAAIMGGLRLCVVF
jgi:hypothetical protein